jgi:transcriptional regulator with PAS, ATPase and Fis domain
MQYIIKYDPNAIAVYDQNLHYIAASDRYIQDYNIQGQNIIGKHHYDVFPEMPQKWKDVHQRVLAGAIERDDDDYFVRTDGSITYNRWECRPWYRADGTIGGMITYTEVTTERKQAEIKLKEQLDELSRWHAATLGREERILELKREVNELLGKNEQPPRYASGIDTGAETGTENANE